MRRSKVEREIDRANGPGVLTLKTGERYEGEFRDGQPHGSGVLTRPDGTQLQGEFRNGQFVGRAQPPPRRML